MGLGNIIQKVKKDAEKKKYAESEKGIAEQEQKDYLKKGGGLAPSEMEHSKLVEMVAKLSSQRTGKMEDAGGVLSMSAKADKMLKGGRAGGVNVFGKTIGEIGSKGSMYNMGPTKPAPTMSRMGPTGIFGSRVKAAKATAPISPVKQSAMFSGMSKFGSFGKKNPFGV